MGRNSWLLGANLKVVLALRKSLFEKQSAANCGAQIGARHSVRRQALGAVPGRMLANRGPKSVPGTRCGARSDASKQGAQIGARHPVRRQAGC
jgi:hypothetical protein